MGVSRGDAGPPMGDSEFQSRLGPVHQGESVVRIRTPYITTLLTAGAAAVAIAAAPMATAAPTTTAPAPMQKSCSTAGGGSECQSPGNVEIYDSPPPVSFEPYGGYGMALGIGPG
jgi:hypothetical protein